MTKTALKGLIARWWLVDQGASTTTLLPVLVLCGPMLDVLLSATVLGPVKLSELAEMYWLN